MGVLTIVLASLLLLVCLPLVESASGDGYYLYSTCSNLGFMESLDLELKSMHKNINCTTVCPYFVNTGMFDGAQTRYCL